MKQTNLTGYGTIGCRIELNHADMIALGVEVNVIKDFLRSLRNDPETKTTLQEITAINRIVFFLEKFVIIPSETNVFTDSPLDFKKVDETVDADDEKMRKELLEHCINRRDGKQVCVDASDYERWANWLGKQEDKADETNVTDEPVPDNSVITVDISKSKDVKNLIKIIYNATDANRNNILDLLNSATHLHVPTISFKYPHMSEGEIIDNLVSAGYKIVPNTAKSLQLETYMPNSDKD